MKTCVVWQIIFFILDLCGLCNRGCGRLMITVVVITVITRYYDLDWFCTVGGGRGIKE